MGASTYVGRTCFEWLLCWPTICLTGKIKVHAFTSRSSNSECVHNHASPLARANLVHYQTLTKPLQHSPPLKRSDRTGANNTDSEGNISARSCSSSIMSQANTFTTSSIIDLAKKTMWTPEGINCQIVTPEPCNAILACWEAYKLVSPYCCNLGLGNLQVRICSVDYEPATWNCLSGSIHLENKVLHKPIQD